jgi:hypothetical protein
MALTSRSLGTLLIGFLAISAGAAIANGRSTALLQACGVVAAVVLAVAVARRSTVGIPALAFVIGAFPVARVVVHGIPLYATDALALLLVLGAVRLGDGLSGYGWLVIVYLGSWALAWLHEVLTLHLFLAPTYGLVRNLLAVSIFFPAYLTARRYGGQARWIVPLAVAAALSASLALAQNLAAGPTTSVLRALAPNFTDTALRTYPHRAFGLFTAPTTLSGFLAVAAILFIGASRTGDRRRRKYLIASAYLCVLGMLATYSRQWLPAVAAGLIALAWLQIGAARRVIVGAAVVLAVTWLLLSTGALNGSYLSTRFSALGTKDANVQTRIARQRAFLSMLRTEPGTFAVGKGFAGQDLVERGLVSAPAADTLRAGLSDNVFFLEIFNHGIVAGLLYAGLFATALLRILAAARRRLGETALLAGIGASLVAAFVLQLSDNYFSESVFMKMFLWFLIGTGIGLVERGRVNV